MDYLFHYNYDHTTSRVDFLKLNAIKPDGNIEPLKRWVLEAAFDELSK